MGPDNSELAVTKIEITEYQKKILYLSGLFTLAMAADLLVTLVFLNQNNVGEQNYFANYLIQTTGLLGITGYKTAATAIGVASFNLVTLYPSDLTLDATNIAARTSTILTASMGVLWIGANFVANNQEAIIRGINSLH